MVSSKTSKLLILIGAIIIALIFILWQILWVSSWQDSEHIADGITINGMDVGGYDVLSAAQMLKLNTAQILNNATLTLIQDQTSFALSTGDFTHYTYEDILNEAYRIARSETFISNYIMLIKTKLFGTNLMPDITINQNTLDDILKGLSAQYDVAPQNASIISFEADAALGAILTISPEVSGHTIDVIQTSKNIKTALKAGQTEAILQTKTVYATITKDMLQNLSTNPVQSAYTFKDISLERENEIMRVIGDRRYAIIQPGAQLNIIAFMGDADYIYFSMPDGGTGSDYEDALTKVFPTQIYIAAVLSELDIVQRKMDSVHANNLPTGTSTVINQYYEMTLENNLDLPVIIRIGYTKQGAASQAFCQIYRSPMTYRTLLRSVIRKEHNQTYVDIQRVYVDNRGNTIDAQLIETITVQDKTLD